MLTVHDVCFYRQDLKTRFPFRYGIASMEEVPQLFVVTEVTFDGIRSQGMSADLLPPKWFTKNADSDFKTDDLPEMLRAIKHAAEICIDSTDFLSFFAWWQQLYKNQMAWAKENAIAPLLASFSISLIERAVLDGICRASESTIHNLLKTNRLEIQFGTLRPELSGMAPADVVVNSPAKQIKLRHTIGMGDPLTAADIPDEDRINDGLPHSLIENIRAYGLNYFKIKLCGDQNNDRVRLIEIAKLLDAEVGNSVRFTMDGNENYHDINHFKEDFNSHRSDSELATFFKQGLLFVEQPLHRDFALLDAVRDGLSSWDDAPLMIIDESDADLNSFPRALDLGYVGTSHKNCKGITKGLLNAASVLHARRAGRRAILSGEDLANIGPVALLQDLAVAASLGIEHVERNGHHFFAGLSGFPSEIQQQTLKHHSDLYQQTETGFVAVHPQNGSLNIASVVAAPFGMQAHPNTEALVTWKF